MNTHPLVQKDGPPPKKYIFVYMFNDLYIFLLYFTVRRPLCILFYAKWNIFSKGIVPCSPSTVLVPCTYDMVILKSEMYFNI